MNQCECIDSLLQTSNKIYSVVPDRVVTKDSLEQLSGWKLTASKPLYKIPAKRRKQVQTKKTNLPMHSKLYPAVVMGGRLNEDYDYIYDGGLSTRAQSCTPVQSTTKLPSLLHLVPAASLVNLNPLITDRSTAISDTARHSLRRLVQMQTKPDVTYERMLIEQRLREMSPLTSYTTSHDKPTHVQSIHQPPSSTKYSKKKKLTNSNAKRNSTLPRSPAFKRKSSQQNDLTPLRTSFSRLLESSSITFCNNK